MCVYHVDWERKVGGENGGTVPPRGAFASG